MVTEDEVGTGEMHEMDTRQPSVKSDASEASSVAPGQPESASFDLQQLIAQFDGVVSISDFSLTSQYKF